MVEQQFDGARLRVARTFRGLTFRTLGESVAASRQFIQQLETGIRQPSDELKGALCSALGFSEAYFKRPLGREIAEADCTFRARRTTLQHVKSRVAAHATLLVEFIDFIETKVSLPTVDIPDCRMATLNDDIDLAAERCREHWQLSTDAPISRMTRVLENAGVVLTTFADVSDKVDALSIRATRPVVVRNTAKPSASRARFDLAHELGHLVLHPTSPTTGNEEIEADRFAAAFLLPRTAVRHEFPPGRLSWPRLFALKRRWRVSVAALVRRAHDCDLIDAAEYRRANVYLRRRGWHVNEPEEGVLEQPEAMPLAFKQMRKIGSDGHAFAAELGVGLDVVESVFGLQLNQPNANVVRLH